MPDHSSDTSPNVLLITVDQWRGDCLGIDGHAVVQTPTLNGLALRGTRFSRAYAATPTCVPARASLLTGLSQESTGRIGYVDGIPFTYPTTIASEFTRQGYQTEAIGKLHVYPERNRVGFEHVRLHDGYLHYARNAHPHLDAIDDYLPWLQRELGRDADYFDNGLNCNSVVARPWDKPEHTHPTNWIVSESLRFLDQRDVTQPFFLYLGFHRPHPPYDPPQWAFDVYINAVLPEPAIGDWEEFLQNYRDDDSAEASVAVYPEQVRQRALAGYYGHMTHIDHQINRLLEVMQEHGVLANTWVCFLSDHGELMGDHNLYRKSMPYEGSARVPLLVVPPSTIEAPRNVVSDQLTELRDVMPTLLDAAGLEIPNDLDGRSLLPLVLQSGEGGHELIHGEHAALGHSVQWMTDGRWKYVWWSGDGREQLFDLEVDPQELHDLALADDAEEHLGPWRGKLVQCLAGREDGHSDGERLVPGQRPRAVLQSVIDAWASGEASG